MTKILLFALPLLCSCNRQPATSAPGRTAVLRIENLTPDASLDWMGRAAAEIIAREISDGKSTILTGSDAGAALAQGATTLILGQLTRPHDRLTLEITKRDAVSQKNTEMFTVAANDPGNLYALADAAAHRLAPQTAPFGTRNNRAIEAWAKALDEPDPAKDYQQAVQADPSFAMAWLSWSAATAARGDRAGASRILADAQQHGAAFTGPDRARIQLAAAELSGDRAQTSAALNELGRLLPDDPAILRAVATQNFAGRQYSQAIVALRKLIQINPADAPVWNELGYALGLTGDYNGAISALQSYQKLSPNDPNPFDSSGDVAFLSGRFADAVRFYDQSMAKDPRFSNSAGLYKSACAYLLAGDVPAAQRKFDAYAAARKAANDPALPLRQADWLYMTGNHDAALAAAHSLASTPNPQLKSAALTQAALWELDAGQRDRAHTDADAALKAAASPIALIARFSTEDAATPADWQSRLDRLLAAPQLAAIKPAALAYAFYFARLWQPAEPLWKQMASSAGHDDSLTGIFYARVLMELNRPKEAEPILRFYPVPQAAGIQEFYSLALPLVRDLRSKTAH